MLCPTSQLADDRTNCPENRKINPESRNYNPENHQQFGYSENNKKRQGRQSVSGFLNMPLI